MLYELKKWINLKSLTIFILLLALNVLLFIRYIKYEDQFLLEDYANYQNLLSASQASASPSDKNPPMQPEGDEYNSGNSSASNYSFAYKEFSAQEKYLETYPDYILDMPSRAANAYALSGGKLSSFASRNVEKTTKDFAGLEKLKLEIGIDKQVIRPFEFKLSDFILIAIVLVMTTNIFTQEYEESIYPMLIASSSRTKIAGDKIAALSFITLIATLFIFASNIISAGFIYGWDNWNRLVQSISAFRSLAIPMTVGTYFLLAILVKFINALTLALMLFMLYTLLKKVVPVILLITIPNIIFYVLYKTIPINSSSNTLHFINPFYGFDAYNLIRNYQNINIFTFPVESLYVWLSICLIMIVISNVVIIRAFQTAAIIKSPHSWTKLTRSKDLCRRNLDKINLHKSIFGAELRKSLFAGKGLLFLIIFALLLVYQVNTSYNYRDSQQKAYNYYLNKLGGRVTEKTLAAIDYERSIIKDSSSYQDAEYLALNNIAQQVKNVQQLEQERGIPAYLVNDLSYAQIMDNRRLDNRDTIAVFWLTALICSGIFAKENEVGAKNLIRITAEQRKLRRSKISITVIYALVIGGMVLSARFFQFKKFYTLTYLQAPVQSHTGWADFPLAWSFETYLTVMLIFRFSAYICLAFVISLISAYAKNESIAAIISTSVTVLPALALYLNLRVLEELSLAWIAEANVLLHGSFLGWIWAVILMLLLSFGSCFAIRKEWQPQTA